MAAARTVLRALEDGAYVDRALRAEARDLDGRDHGLARQLAYAAVQRRATLDFWIEELTERDPESLDADVRVPLQLGLVQLHFLDRIPPHAAVGETVGVAEALSPRGGAKLVNAVLRRASSSGLPELPSDDEPSGAAIRHSFPRWLAERWFAELGPDEARALMERCNEPAERAIRVNALKATREQVQDELTVETHGDPELEDALVLEDGVALERTAAWQEGRIVAQSRGAQLAGVLLAPQAGERVVELCAAPGGKTSHLAALMGGGEGVVAVERHEGRAGAMRELLDRLGAGDVTVVHGDALEIPPSMEGSADAVLLDPPCGALGTLQRQPDVRWRTTPASIERLAGLQVELLRSAMRLVKPGGRLLYSVCSIGHEESDDVLAAAGVEAAERRSVLPHVDGTDGFEYALVRA